jgi:hypothetical protein
LRFLLQTSFRLVPLCQPLCRSSAARSGGPGFGFSHHSPALPVLIMHIIDHILETIGNLIDHYNDREPLPDMQKNSPAHRIHLHMLAIRKHWQTIYRIRAAVKARNPFPEEMSHVQHHSRRARKRRKIHPSMVRRARNSTRKRT